MKKKLPLAIIFIVGILGIVQYFIPSKPSQVFFNYANDWLRVIGTFAIILGLGSLLEHHWHKIKRKRRNWQYSIVLFISFAVMALAGFIWGMQEGTLFDNMFNYIQIPLGATMFSLLSFYMASAAYRSFRAKSYEATLLLVAAFIVMLGMVPLGESLFVWIPNWLAGSAQAVRIDISDLAHWILAYPNMSAQRGIMLGVGIGMIATSLKIILGIERAYMGGSK